MRGGIEESDGNRRWCNNYNYLYMFLYKNNIIVVNVNVDDGCSS